MSFRDTINKNPAIIAAAVLVVIGAAVYMTYRNVAPQTRIGGGIYFTDDDGQTFYTGKLGDFSPTDHNGKKAYRAFIFKCADGKPFVGYMERMPEDVIALIKKAKSDPNSVTDEEKSKLMVGSQMKQMKKPGEKDWQPLRPVGVPVNCPDGKPAMTADE